MFEVLFNMWPDVFVTAGDKAKLITIVISSFVAISIFVLNQIYINNRNRKALLIEKIEELYLLKIEFGKSAEFLIMHHINEIDMGESNSNLLDRDKAYKDLQSVQEKMFMIISLYFWRSKRRLGCFSFYSFSPEGYWHGRDVDEALKLIESDSKRLKKIDSELSSLCINLMNRQTCNILKRFINKFEDTLHVNINVAKNVFKR